MRTSKELREATDPAALRAIGSLRRMAITLTAKALWQLAGFRMPDGKIETAKAEPFTGIGFASRPSSSGSPEALVLMIGDAGTPVIAAVRDERTRARSAGDLSADETAMFNTLARMVIRAGGTIELGPVTGAVLESMIKGQTYRAAEDTLLTALGVFATAIGALNPATAAASATTLNAAITAFKAAAATYLSQVGKVG